MTRIMEKRRGIGAHHYWESLWLDASGTKWQRKYNVARQPIVAQKYRASLEWVR